ncbi:16S rRNA (guanine(966)-N(2))-methyltransferase RsmD [Corallococcus terminator]
MRIVSGSAKGRAIAGPKSTSLHIRPTADRVRETIFNVLGQFLDGQRVLDLYAGTGALGLEALSRGAGNVVLVDQDREAQALCRQNTDALGFASQVELLAQPVVRALESLRRRNERFELIFADPPYAARVVETVLEGVTGAALLAPSGMLVVEHDKREGAPDAHAGLTLEDQRRFGDTLVSFYRAP